MKKIMNKKGFTLVELLAVIVILAVIVLVAMNAVIPQMEKSRKNAFLTEVNTFASAAETWYTEKMVTGGKSGDSCVAVTDLIGDYVDKKSSGYEGVVCIVTSKATAAANGTKIAIHNGAYYFAGDIRDAEYEEIKDKTDSINIEISAPNNSNDTVEAYQKGTIPSVTK